MRRLNGCYIIEVCITRQGISPPVLLGTTPDKNAVGNLEPVSNVDWVDSAT